MSAATTYDSHTPETTGANAAAKAGWKKVLVVSFDFPPRRTSAVYRMVGLTRSLPELGWKPTVLTIESLFGAQEPELLEKLPREVRVERTRYLRMSGWEKAAARAVRGAGAFRTGPGDVRQSRLDRWLRRGGKALRSTLYFPDETIGWLPFALARAIRLHRKEKFDLVYTTSPPRATPIIGLLLKRLCGIPWVSEFMDPWYPRKSRIRTSVEHWLEARLVHGADRMVVMVPGHAEELAREFRLGGEKLAVVRNGFFEEDFASLGPAPRLSLAPDLFHLSHFGTIYPANEGKFFHSLNELLIARPALRKRLRLHLVGAGYDTVLRYASQPALREIIEVHGFLPNRSDVLDMMRASDGLLLLWGRPDFSRMAAAGKTYDYLRSGRPILAVTGAGAVRQLVEEARAGWAVEPGDVAGMQRALLEAIENGDKPATPQPVRPEYVAQFQWDRQAGLLARTFDEAIDHGR